MDFSKKSQPAWPFPKKVRFKYIKPKVQPKGAYRDNFSPPVLPKTLQTPWANSLFW